jgi:hypothetical protein
MVEGRWHRVCLNTIVRKGVALDSDRLRILPMGSKVYVVEAIDRRVRIEQPINGWCSLKSSNGDTILAPVEDANATQRSIPQTPLSSQVNKSGSKLQTFKNRAEAANERAEQQSANITQLTKQLPDSIRRDAESIDFKKSKAELQAQIAEMKAKITKSDPTAGDIVTRLADAVAEKQTALNDSELYGQMQKAAAAEYKNLQQEFDKLAQQATKQASDQLYYPRDVIKFSSGLAVVKYYGPVDGFDCSLLGLEYSDPVGDSNGSINGKVYFECTANYGAFVREDDERVGRRLPAEQLLLQLHRYTESNVRDETAIQ